jgi:hypothetical protein
MAQDVTTATEQKIEDFAEDLGRMLGSARGRAERWLGERQTIVKNLTELRETASKLLSELGHDAERIRSRGRKPGRPAADQDGGVKRAPGRPAGSGRKKKRTMSPEARAAISRAQKARWAQQKAGGPGRKR